MTDATGLQTPILVCCESEEEDETRVFYGTDCTEQFFDYLDEQTIDQYGQDRQIIVIFHNFKGYDGTFVLKYLYEQHRFVHNQIIIGTKVLSLKNELISRSYCCYGNLLCHKINSNLFIDSWAVC